MRELVNTIKMMYESAERVTLNQYYDWAKRVRAARAKITKLNDKEFQAFKGKELVGEFTVGDRIANSTGWVTDTVFRALDDSDSITRRSPKSAPTPADGYHSEEELAAIKPGDIVVVHNARQYGRAPENDFQTEVGQDGYRNGQVSVWYGRDYEWVDANDVEIVSQ